MTFNLKKVGFKKWFWQKKEVCTIELSITHKELMKFMDEKHKYILNDVTSHDPKSINFVINFE